MSEAPALATGRSCAGCTMCCKLMGIAEDFFEEVQSEADSLGGLLLEI